MPPAFRVALVGDHHPAVVAHQAIPRAIALAAAARNLAVTHEWLATDTIEGPSQLAGFDGVWCVPASPYRSMEGALLAIRFARTTPRPFLGTCGGFQHAVIEYARNVLGWPDADHAETNPGAARAVITPLACGLLDQGGVVHFDPDSRLGRAYGVPTAVEGYLCRYGLNPAFVSALALGPLRITATDEVGDVRAIELTTHPFFVATLFQPERAALQDRVPPIVAAFLSAVARN